MPVHSNYRVIFDNNKDKFEATIEGLINNGWQLLGGVCVSALPDGMINFAQALTK